MQEVYYRFTEELVREKILACGRQLQEVTIVVVSKTRSVDSIQAVYQEGGRIFGESRVQEALQKIPYLPADCQWHLVGTLQRNKVVKALPVFHLIHSVDNLQLAQKI